MTESGPGIALLFGDGELGDQLRLALQEHGARIVHEGSMASLNRDLLMESGAEVVVVNLDDENDDALDRLYDVIDGDTPRVVFNDGQASRALEGWDRARWARHLAAKVMASADVDPPRPLTAASLVVPAATPSVAESAELTVDTVPAAEEAVTTAVSSATETDGDLGFDEPASIDQGIDGPESADSNSLEAELEAMLASDALSTGEDEFGSGLRYFENAPALHDGEFGDVAGEAAEASDAVNEPAAEDSVGTEPVAAAATSFDFDHLPTDLSLAGDAALVSEKAPAPTVVSAPDSWALLDDDAPVAPAPAPATVSATDFGVVKQTAAEFLSPEVEHAAPATEPVMSLQLLTMEEAVAPQPYSQDSEMHLDDNTRRLHRVVLLGAAADGLDSVCEFLSALTAPTRSTFLLTQHLGAQSISGLMEVLSVGGGPLPVRLATDGDHAVPGELLVVPAASQVSLRRDGAITVQANEPDAGNESSIDANFSTVATIFGRDVVSIVFAGSSTDAVAGAQAVHDLGGEVWVEAASDVQYSDMVGSIFAERLVSFSGAPHELAAHLIEVYP
ncbi:chemotaxis protein CheB [Rhodanobacter ginsenosidimutans]|uniref:protein-glutamate methylesterase n=1 Tax=Rhodanobacter ginsenosidimutans TaxID=490571 RepID=A0ABW0JXF4_9GAMM